MIINIVPGNRKPYYLKDKGLKPSGVYLRYGRNKIQANYEEIKRMIRESDELDYESLISSRQNLTFEYLSDFFRKNNLVFDNYKMITMGFKNNINEFTNLAYLFSNQYDVETKVAVFQDVDRSIFKSKKEFNGSILKQINDVLDYVHLCNETRIVIGTGITIEKQILKLIFLPIGVKLYH